MTGRYWKIALLAGVVAVGGCDCEDRVRALLYGGEDRPVTPLGDSDEEEAAKWWEDEPNDSPEDATSIPLASDMRSMYATIEPSDDVDWFSLELDDDEPWMVELTIEPEDPDLDVAVYLEVPGDGDHAPLMYNVAGAGQPESIPMLRVESDQPRRFFVTSSDGGTGEYHIDVRRRLSAAVVAMAPNDHPHLAMALDVPGEVQGFYDRPHDRDVFYVAAESLQAGVYSLEISNIPGVSQTLHIYGDDELESRLMEIGVSERRPAVIPNLSLSADRGEGLYFVLTSGEDYDRERGYRLRLIEHPVSDEYALEREPNNSAVTAQPVDFDQPLRGYLHTPGDVDRFRLTIGDPEMEDEAEELEEADEESDEADRRTAMEQLREEAEEEEKEGEEEQTVETIDPWEPVPEKEPHEYVVQARLAPLDDAHRLAMRWLPGEGTDEERVEVRADEPGDGVVVCNRVLEPGEYDLEVRSVETDNGFRPRSYDYELQIANIADTPKLEIEPNDSPQQADRMPMGSQRKGFITPEDDVDVFAFVVGPDEPKPVEADVISEGPEVAMANADEQESAAASSGETGGWEAPQTEQVRISVTGNRLNLGFELLDDEQGRVARVNEAGPGGDEQLNIDLPHGLYYVAVSASSGSVCEPYTIGVETR